MFSEVISDGFLKLRSELCLILHHQQQGTLGFGCAITFHNMSFCLIDVKKVKVTGNTSVEEGETLNLSCSVESFPPSLIMWTKLSDKNVKNGRETNLQNDTLTDSTESDLQSNTETANLTIPNVTAEHAGQYICTVKHLNNTLTEEVDITVLCKYTVHCS